MLSKLLVKTFIKDYKNISSEKVRGSYGFFAGLLGALINLILFITKLLTGMIVGSIAVTADAFNNLSDAASSIITVVGFTLSSRPADKEHPFGHGRIEYIAGMIVSFMVMLVGYQFIKTSIERIMNPGTVTFQLVPFILLLLSVLLKIWMSRFNRYIGKTIDSSALKAASYDALWDVVTSTTVAISLLLANFTAIPIDGYIGVLVALAILFSGYKLVRETISPLLGEAPSQELIQGISQRVLSYPYITGVHDLIIHNYGPGKCMASIHAEIPSDINIMKIHEIIDQAEREVSEDLNIYLVIHMDPISTDSADILEAKLEVEEIIKKYPLVKSMHDFRVVGEKDRKNIIFDIVIDYDSLKKTMSEDELSADIKKEILKLHPEYNCIITIDHDYMQTL